MNAKAAEAWHAAQHLDELRDSSERRKDGVASNTAGAVGTVVLLAAPSEQETQRV